MKNFFIVLCLLLVINTSSMTFIQKDENVTLEIYQKDESINDYYEVLKLKGYSVNEEHLDLIYYKSMEYGIDYELIIALVSEESSFRQFAKNYNTDDSEDFGYFQLNNKWHPQFKDDVESHIEYGIVFFKWCLIKEEGNIIKALSRYNSGRSSSKAGIEYAKRVLSKKEEFEALFHFQNLMR